MTKNNIFFSGSALITLEGDAVFSFVSRESNHVIYRVIGFNDKLSIYVIDYRSVGLEAIDDVVKTDDKSGFAKQFCNPAEVQIRSENDKIIIELKDIIGGIGKDFMLWIATGVEEPIPDYEHIFLQLEPFTSNTYALVSVFNYQRFQAYFDGMKIPSLVEKENQSAPLNLQYS